MQQQFTTAPNPDQIPQPSLPHPLAHRGAAEYHRLDAQKTRIRRQIDLQPPIQRATIEQDRLLRQPFQRRLRLAPSNGSAPETAHRPRSAR